MPPYWSVDFGTAEISFIIISKEACFVKRNFLFFSKYFGYTSFGVKGMKLWKTGLIFCAGGAVYVGMELCWRGRSHISMFLAGGLCLLLIGHLEEVEPRLPLPLRVLAGAGIITMTELGIGLAVNRDFAVWDYRDVWGNWLGQICPAFCLAWIPGSWLALHFHRRLKKLLEAY